MTTNNSRVWLITGAVQEIDQSDLRTVMERMFFGPVWRTQATLPHMRAQGCAMRDRDRMQEAVDGASARKDDVVHLRIPVGAHGRPARGEGRASAPVSPRTPLKSHER